MRLRGVRVSWLLVLICIGCSEPGEPILRGSKTLSEPSAPAQPVAAAMEVKGDAGAEPSVAEGDQPAKDTKDTKVSTRRPLNLSLPAELAVPNHQLPTNMAPLPDLFQRTDDIPGMSLSGRLYWDETEHAEEVPILDSINGAGVEIEIRTP
ncbi:hypothetical protein GCM10011297_00170 [Bacterioplanes sanyensis]|uniref:hypothetical protein n=1 Tax=Bacterioplanes sanyensis TaxID=1249553 RepID=UPI0016775E08|nr:hypothetical protein [Bacterioplanes sanyensis]GGY31444.1 hypothetical protein GCM10011297_00170 [Bacterioplanes sanyensis]